MYYDLRKSVEEEQRHMTSLLEDLEKEMRLLPEGSLSQKRIKGRTYLYRYVKESETSDERKRSSRAALQGKPVLPRQKCLSRGDADLAAALQRKHFIKKCIPLLRNNLRTMELFLRSYKPIDSTEIYEKMPAAYRQLPMPEGAQAICDGISRNRREEALAWCGEPYEKNELFPESLLHVTLGGRKLRSKSELVIASVLEAKRIPFRYEAALSLGDKIYYPDFTILSPRDGKVYYWEHFGMMNDGNYEVSMERKLSDYRKHGIVNWDNLILTYDDLKGALDSRIIHRLIRVFLEE